MNGRVWTGVDGAGARKRLEMGGEKDWWAGAGWKWVSRRTGGQGKVGNKDRWAGASVDARRCVGGVDARERLEMGGEKDRWAGASVAARTCADGVGAYQIFKIISKLRVAPTCTV